MKTKQIVFENTKKQIGEINKEIFDKSYLKAKRAAAALYGDSSSDSMVEYFNETGFEICSFYRETENIPDGKNTKNREHLKRG